MMKRTGCFFIMSLVFISIIAQSNIRLNNFWDKTYFINPASINALSVAEFNVAARKQWVSFPGAPTTFFASATTYLENLNTQFGVKLMQDKIGYTSTTSVDLSYSYSMLLQMEWRLNLGMAVSYQSLSYDRSTIVFPSVDDPIGYGKLLNENNFNSNLGVELTNKFWKFGASSQNVFSLFSSINNQFTNANFLYGMYKQRSHDYVNLGFGVCGIQYGNLFQTELNLTGYFKVTPQTEAFQLGLFYRTWSEMGVLFGIDLTKEIHLSYSYDFNVSGISRSSIGSHELILTYKLGKVWKCVNCWY